MKNGMKKTVWGLMAAGLAATVWNALAGPLPEGAVPLPYVKPNAPTVSAFMPASPEITGAIPRLNRPDDASQLKAGLDALSSRDAARAIALRNAMPNGGLDRHILTWAIAVSGQKDVASAEIAAAQRELVGWPGAATLRANSEKALYREDPPARGAHVLRQDRKLGRLGVGWCGAGSAARVGRAGPCRHPGGNQGACRHP